MRLQPGSGIESRTGDAEPDFVVESGKEGRKKSPDELRQEYEALGECASTHRAANLRISVILDVRTVLKEVFEWACRLFLPSRQGIFWKGATPPGGVAQM